MPVMENIEIRIRQDGNPNGLAIARIDQNGIKFLTAPVIGTILPAPLLAEGEQLILAEEALAVPPPALAPMVSQQMAINANIANEGIIHTIGDGQWRLAKVYVAVASSSGDNNMDVVLAQDGRSLLTDRVNTSEVGLHTPNLADLTLSEGDSIAIRSTGGSQGNATIYLERVV
jgi:hypothetical protein